jgi:hypothetical protein
MIFGRPGRSKSPLEDFATYFTDAMLQLWFFVLAFVLLAFLGGFLFVCLRGATP